MWLISLQGGRAAISRSHYWRCSNDFSRLTQSQVSHEALHSAITGLRFDVSTVGTILIRRRLLRRTLARVRVARAVLILGWEPRFPRFARGVAIRISQRLIRWIRLNLAIVWFLGRFPRNRRRVFVLLDRRGYRVDCAWRWRLARCLTGEIV